MQCLIFIKIILVREFILEKEYMIYKFLIEY